MMISTQTIHWTELPPLTVSQGGGAAGIIGNRVVVAGGTNWHDGQKRTLSTVQVLDLGSGKWSAGPELPYGLAYGPALVLNGRLTIFGGFDGEKFRPGILELDEAGKVWRTTGETPAVTVLGRAVLLGGAVYLLGGCPNAADVGACHSDVFARGGDGSWRKVAALPEQHLALFGAAGFGNEIFVFGGTRPSASSPVENQRAVWALDVKSGKWRKAAELPEATRGAAALTVKNRVYVLGGYGAKFLDTVLVFDPASGKFEPASGFPLAAMTEFVAAGNRIVGAGGEDAMKHRTARVVTAVLD